MLDTTPLGDACRDLLEAAATVADSGMKPVPPPDEWGAEQILAHVVIVNAVTLATISDVAAGVDATYDNRAALYTWNLDRVIALSGGDAGLRERIRLQGEALCALAGSTLSDAELDTQVPTLLLSNGTVLVDQPMPLRVLLKGLAEVEIPGHTRQLLALLPDHAFRTAETALSA
ncbi:hypothetical protein ACFYY8_28620 [Streptosporangium sp. NPDC001559]|uniref:hypothetical protein n=1 Tax=Streptosporangium sp. NPDC001559 TaxID=3366187 RepID=UPI0036E32D91